VHDEEWQLHDVEWDEREFQSGNEEYGYEWTGNDEKGWHDVLLQNVIRFYKTK
jgi:hypothetical protein